MARQIVHLLLAVLFGVISVVLAQNDVYFAVGGKLVLEPKPVQGPITSITWKSDGDIVTEYIKDVVPLADYGDFKDRTTMDINTGVLTINTPKSSDVGPFTVEINNRVQPEVYTAVELQKVPKPEVVLRPLTCKDTSQNCTVSCDGPVERPNLVSYFWKLGNRDWEKSEKDRELINDEETKAVELLSCKMQNPVSEEESKPFKNPFYQPPSSSTGLIVGMIFLVLFVVFLCVLLAFFKRARIQECVSKRGGGNTDAEAPAENDNKNVAENKTHYDPVNTSDTS